MIWFFYNAEEANIFEQTHPDWEPVTMCTGYVTGSLFVLYRKPKPYEQPFVPMSAEVNRITLEPAKRRGRPPKENA